MWYLVLTLWLTPTKTIQIADPSWKFRTKAPCEEAIADIDREELAQPSGSVYELKCKLVPAI